MVVLGHYGCRTAPAAPVLRFHPLLGHKLLRGKLVRRLLREVVATYWAAAHRTLRALRCADQLVLAERLYAVVHIGGGDWRRFLAQVFVPQGFHGVLVQGQLLFSSRTELVGLTFFGDGFLLEIGASLLLLGLREHGASVLPHEGAPWWERITRTVFYWYNKFVLW